MRLAIVALVLVGCGSKDSKVGEPPATSAGGSESGSSVTPAPDASGVAKPFEMLMEPAGTPAPDATRLYCSVWRARPGENGADVQWCGKQVGDSPYSRDGLYLAPDGRSVPILITCESCKTLHLDHATPDQVTFEGGKATVTLDFLEALGDLSTESTESWINSDSRPVEIAWKAETTRSPAEGGLNLPASGVFELLQKVTKGPLLFARDRARYKDANISLVSSEGHHAGANVKLREADLIAFLDHTETKVGTCAYINPTTKETKDVPRYRYQLTMKVYERRTGKQIATKKMGTANPPCEDFISSDTKSLGQWIQDDTIQAWLDKLVASNATQIAEELRAAEAAGTEVGWTTK